MRWLHALLLSLACLAPITASAQAGDVDPEAQAADGSDYEPDQRGADEAPDPQYEPDQRGVEEGGDYEPDQRGDHDPEDEPESEPRVELTGATMDAEAAYAPGGALFGFHASLWLGGGYTGLDALGAEDLVRETQRGGGGFSFGVVVGPRLGPVDLGLRHTITVDGGFTMGTLGLDTRLALPALGPVIPTVRLGVGYAFFLGLSDPLPAQAEARLDGIYAELGLGAALRVGGPFLVGAEVSAGWTHLFRQPVPGCATECADERLDLRRAGEGDGLTLRLHLWGGVSF